MSDSGGGAAAAVPFAVVEAEGQVQNDVVGWLLVQQDNHPIAFLSPAAVAEAAGEQPLQYLRGISSGIGADLTDVNGVYFKRLQRDIRGRSVVVFDKVQTPLLGLDVQLPYDLAQHYCEFPDDPLPPELCDGCVCTAGQGYGDQ